MKNQFLTFPFEVKSADEAGNIEGYASTFGNMDFGMDIVDRGAFKKTLRENAGKFPILADHNPCKQIGWNLAAEEDDKGLYVKGCLDIKNNVTALEKYSLAKMGMGVGAKVGLSIGYMTIKAEPDPENPSIRRLKELKLYEYSLVTFPMNDHAMVTAAKSWELMQAIDLSSGLDLFVETMLQKGYSEVEIHEALAKRQAAKSETNPEDSILQLLRSESEKLSSALRA